MATKSRKPGALLEELRAIRDRISRKLMTMTPEEQMIYVNSLGKIDPTAKKSGTAKRSKPVAKRRRPTTKQRA